MNMLYNSDSFVVVQFELPEESDAPGATRRGGYEIVDKFARKEIYLQGAVAESFQRGVQALVDESPTEEREQRLDDYIAGFVTLAQQPVVLH
jgi:Protein of unknown function (DUF3567)